MRNRFKVEVALNSYDVDLVLEMNAWCSQHIGFRGPLRDYDNNPWNVLIGKDLLTREYLFLNEEDATMFILRWR